jgi:hypothetical protein
MADEIETCAWCNAEIGDIFTRLAIVDTNRSRQDVCVSWGEVLCGDCAEKFHAMRAEKGVGNRPDLI